MLKLKLINCLNKLKENQNINDFCEITQIKTVKNRKAAFIILFEPDEDCVVRLDNDLYYRQKINTPCFRLEAEGDYNCSFYPVGYMADDDGVAKGDILLTDGFLELDKGKARGVWVDIDIPVTTKDGVVTIKLYRSFMFSDEEFFTEQSLDVSVIDYTLPDAKDFSFYLDLWQHTSNIARKHEVKPFGRRHFEILEEYVKSLAVLGQKAVTVVVSEIPWAGQSCFESEGSENLYEYSMVKVTKRQNGRFTFDFSAVKKYMEICQKHGIDREISVYGLVNVWKGKAEYGFEKPCENYPDHIRVRYYDEAGGLFRFMHSSEEIENYIKAIYRFFKRTKLIDKVRIAADEPGDIESFRQSINRIRQIAPGFKFKAAVYHIGFVREFGFISDFVPFITTLCQGYEDISKLAGKDRRILWYVCCGPDYPNTFIKSEAFETLFIAALTSYLNLDGFLRWNYTVFPDNPRANIKCRNFPAGDVNFVYPANDGTPLLTVRYKALRYAAELFEMLEEVKQKADKAETDGLFSIIIKENDLQKYFPKSGNLPKDKMMSVENGDYDRLFDKIHEILAR